MPALCTEEQTLEVCNERRPGAWFIVKLFLMVPLTIVPGVPSFWVWLITSTGDYGIAEDYHGAVRDALRMAAALGLLLLQSLAYVMILAIW